MGEGCTQMTLRLSVFPLTFKAFPQYASSNSSVGGNRKPPTSTTTVGSGGGGTACPPSVDSGESLVVEEVWVNVDGGQGSLTNCRGAMANGLALPPVSFHNQGRNGLGNVI